MAVFNFGLVHEPPEFDYSIDWRDPPAEILKTLQAANDEWEEILQSFTEEELLLLRWRMCWKALARGKQLPPPEFESMEKPFWGIRSGRGFGKTLTAANWLGIEAAMIFGRYAVVAPTHDDVRYTCFEGPTGLYSVIPPKLIIDKNVALPSCTLWNGSFIRGFAGDTPERLRGPQHNAAWCDEIASWKYPQNAWDQLMFGLRLGNRPRICWTGTPKPTSFMRKLNDDKRTIVVTGSTYENRDNLTDFFYENVAKYEGTKVGRQELYGEILDPEEEGFVKRSEWRMWPKGKPLPRFRYVILSLDTAFTERTHDKKEQQNDPTACSVWGIFGRKYRTSQADQLNIILLDAWEDWLGFNKLLSVVKKARNITYGDTTAEPMLKPKVVPIGQRPSHQGRKADLILIEEKGSGISLKQALDDEGIRAHGYNPGKADKLTRLHVVTPMFAHGRVWAVESDVNPGKFKQWAEPLITQVCSYVGEGSTEHDDLLDTTTQALRYAMNKFPFGPFTVKPDLEKQAEEIRARERRKVGRNPYDG